MGTSKTQPSKWMGKAGNDKTNAEWMGKAGNDKTNANIIATERGWERDLGNGQRELLQACSGLSVQITAPLISGVTFQRKRNLSIAAGDKITIKVHFTEAVTLVSGAPTITFDENGVSRTAAYVPGSSDENTLVFEYTVANAGVVDNFTTSITGTCVIEDVDSNAVNKDFPADFAAPAMTVVA